MVCLSLRLCCFRITSNFFCTFGLLNCVSARTRTSAKLYVDFVCLCLISIMEPSWWNFSIQYSIKGAIPPRMFLTWVIICCSIPCSFGVMLRSIFLTSSIAFFMKNSALTQSSSLGSCFWHNLNTSFQLCKASLTSLHIYCEFVPSTADNYYILIRSLILLQHP